MNTPTHFIMTGALKRALPKNWNINGKAFLWGSIAPDIPLYLLSLGAFLYYPIIQGTPLREAANHVFGTLYFQDTIWIAFHNFLHSPLNLLLLLGGTFLLSKTKYKQYAPWLYAFLSACALHSFVDVLTHNDDGPLLFFPFDLSVRYESPISYWDPEHGGSTFFKFEIGLTIFLLIYWVWPKLKEKFC